MVPFSTSFFLSCQWFSCVFCLVAVSFSGISLVALLPGFPVVLLLRGFLPLLCLSLLFLGFPVGLWELFCLGRISGSLLDGVVLWTAAVTFWGFLSSFSFLVMLMPFWFLCVGRFMLLSFSSSCLAPLFLWVYSSWGSVILFSRRRFQSWCLLRPSVVFFRLFSLVCRLLSSRFPLPSSGSSLVLSWLPFLPSFSFLFLPWLGSFSLRQFSLVMCCCRLSAGFLVTISVSCSSFCPFWSLFLALLGIRPCVILLPPHS